MHIAVDIRSLMSPIRTGVGEYTYELLNALFSFDTKNRYTLFSNSFSDVSAHLPVWGQSNVQHIGLHFPNKLLNFSLRFLHRPRLDRVLGQQEKIDIFFSPNIHFTALSRDTKHVLMVHDLSFEFIPESFSLKRKLWHWFINPRRLCEEATAIITPSESTKQDIVEYYDIEPEKIHVVYPRLPSVYVQVALTEEDKKIKEKYHLPNRFILFLGTIEPRKNIEAIIQAYTQVRSSLSEEYSLIIAGARGWKCSDIFRMIEHSPGVQYIGYVDAADKPALYRLATIFMYPSLYEGFGLPILEAMACGTSVITSNRSSLPEVAGEGACLVDPSNTADIAFTLASLLRNQEKRDILRKKALERVHFFQAKEQVQQFLALLSSLD